MNDSRLHHKRRLSGYRRVLVVWAALACPLWAAGPVVMIIGPPGSGRSTQAEMLRKEMGLPLISADTLVEQNPQKFQKNRSRALSTVEPRLDPALNELVEQALQSTDLSKGVILDGYPATKGQGDFLAGLRNKFGLPPSLVIHLNVPDDVVRKRLKTAQGRDIDQELKDYHREFDFVRDYFPQADIRAVDGTKPPAEVAKQILKIVQGLHQ